MRDHYFAPGIFAEDVRWIARRAHRVHGDAGSGGPQADASVDSSQDDMKRKSKPKQPSGWEPVVPAVPFRRDGPWELGPALE